MSQKGKLNRRAFLGASAGALAGVLASGNKALGLLSEPAAHQPKEKSIILRTLGKTGYKIPVVSMGVMNADNPELVFRAYELGIRHFDTAAGYQRGRNEEMVGQVIEELKARDKVVIATKIFIPPQQRNQLSADKIKEIHLKAIDECLTRLRTDYVDILYSHNVPEVSWVKNPGLMEALQEIKAQKKARFIGLSTHQNMDEVIRAALEMKIYEVILATFNYSLYDYPEYLETLKKAASRGVGLIAMKTQCQQPWYRENNPPEIKKFYEGPLLNAALLKWVLRHEFITTAVPGFTTFDQLNEDITVAYNLEYTPEEKKFLENRLVKTQMAAVCRLCGQCQATCSHKVDIPNILRAHMYATAYGNLYEARETLDSIEQGKSIEACLDCEDCTARCVRGVNIKRRIEELKTLYA
ncbi:MAG: aldo/keto reductase [Candidatus Saccharicenans sp.]